MPCLGVFVYSVPFWVAERIQREIWPDATSLYASNGFNLALLRAYTLNPKLLNPKTVQAWYWTPTYYYYTTCLRDSQSAGRHRTPQ